MKEKFQSSKHQNIKSAQDRTRRKHLTLKRGETKLLETNKNTWAMAKADNN